MLTRPDAPFSFYDATRPIYTHARFLPPSRLRGCRSQDVLVAEGCFIEDATISDSVVGVRATIGAGTRIERSVLFGADYYEPRADARHASGIPIGIGRDVVLDRVIVDKNARIGAGARLVNQAGSTRRTDRATTSATASSSCPKDGVIPPGTVV